MRPLRQHYAFQKLSPMVKTHITALITAFRVFFDITLHTSFAVLIFAALTCSLVLIVIAGNCWALGSETSWVTPSEISDLPRNMVAALGEIPTIAVGVAFLGAAFFLKVVLDKIAAADFAEGISRLTQHMRRTQ